jgi:hypothetical protein
MTLWPYLITKGWLPYRDIAIAHTPLMLGLVSIAYKIFGTGILQLKIFTWILVLGADVLIFGVAKKLWNLKTTFVVVSAFAFWQLFFDGNGLWFDLFMGLAAIAAYYFIQKKNYFLAGIFWALAFLSKQTAIWFLLPIGLELVQSAKHLIEGFKKFVQGVFLIVIPSVLIIWLLGILPDFYNWAVKFGIFVLPRASGQVQLPGIKNLFISILPFLVFVPLIWKRNQKNITLLIWAIAGALGAYPRFEYFHLQPAVAFLAIATAQLLVGVKKPGKLIKLFIPIYLLGSIYLFAGFFMRNFREGTRFYETNVTDIVTFVNYNTNRGDTIFILNWWDNIYALTSTLPAIKPWIPQLSWYMEIPGVQEKMIADLKVNRPKLIIYNPYTELGLSAYIPRDLYNFITENYKLSQRVDNLEILVQR